MRQFSITQQEIQNLGAFAEENDLGRCLNGCLIGEMITATTIEIKNNKKRTTKMENADIINHNAQNQRYTEIRKIIKDNITYNIIIQKVDTYKTSYLLEEEHGYYQKPIINGYYGNPIRDEKKYEIMREYYYINPIMQDIIDIYNKSLQPTIQTPPQIISNILEYIYKETGYIDQRIKNDTNATTNIWNHIIYMVQNKSRITIDDINKELKKNLIYNTDYPFILKHLIGSSMLYSEESILLYGIPHNIIDVNKKVFVEEKPHMTIIP